MSEAATVTRTRSVLELAHKTEGEVRFGSLVEGKGGRMELDHHRPTVLLSADQWTDLGQPEAITIAIWPGDRQDLFDDDATYDGFPA